MDVLLLRKRSPSKKKKKHSMQNISSMRKTKIFKKITNGRREKNICLKKEVIKKKWVWFFGEGLFLFFGATVKKRIG